MDTRSVLLGDSPAVRRRYVLVGLALGMTIVLLSALVRASRIFASPGGGLLGAFWAMAFVGLFFVVSFGVTIYAGFRQAGVLVCIAIPTAVVLGVNVAFWLSGSKGLHWMAWFWGLPLGTVAYFVGTGLRWGHRALRDGSST